MGLGEAKDWKGYNGRSEFLSPQWKSMSLSETVDSSLL